MHKVHVTFIALLLAAAAVLGAVAVARMTGLGTAARHTNDAAFAARARQLTRFERQLRKELTARPPALPVVPKHVTPVASPQPAPAPAPRIVYHQPPPVVVTVHRKHADDGSPEAEGGGGGDD